MPLNLVLERDHPRTIQPFHYQIKEKKNIKIVYNLEICDLLEFEQISIKE
jgi:hypothetical protein